jgi:hypothetical protein
MKKKDKEIFVKINEEIINTKVEKFGFDFFKGNFLELFNEK